MKRSYLLFPAVWIVVLVLNLSSCTQQTDSSTAPATAETPEAPREKAAPLSNAEDTMMPNTMALAAEYQRFEHYDGTIDGKIAVNMVIRVLQGTARGTITYKKSGKPILLLGRMEDNGTFFLREFQPDGLVTGVMSGTTKDGKISGKWYGTNNDKEYVLQLRRTDDGSPDTEWPYDVKGTVAGKYGYHYPKDSEGNPGAEGLLTVRQSGDKVTFTFDCVTGGPGYNMAMMEDTEGILEGNEVWYSSTEYGECAFVIRFYDGFTIVEQEEGKYDCGFGHNAGVEGEYVKL
jgi:hypothetical protein